MQALGRSAVLDQRARELIDDAVSRNVEAWAKTIKLTPSDARFAHFREDVTGALHRCIERHNTGQDPFFKTRTADRRKHLKEEADEARDLAERLRAFNNKYVVGQVTLVFRTGRVFNPAAPAEDFDARALLLEEIVGDLRDAAGPQPRLRAFKALATELIRAYSRATGRKGTGVGAREGSLLDLVEAVLAAACKVAEDLTGQPLQTPSPNNLGEQLHEIASGL
jgi:hypothetical protein